MNCSIPDCDNPQEGTTGFCASHNWQIRKTERDAKKIKVIRPVRKVTEKRDKENKEYSKLRKDFLEHKMVCEVRFIGCQITSSEIHHCSLSQKNFLNIKTWKAICSVCHRDLEDMPAEERRLKGFLTN